MYCYDETLVDMLRRLAWLEALTLGIILGYLVVRLFLAWRWRRWS